MTSLGKISRFPMWHKSTGELVHACICHPCLVYHTLQFGCIRLSDFHVRNAATIQNTLDCFLYHCTPLPKCQHNPPV